MPPLKNPRHEAFAQQLVLGQKHGWTQGTCYSRAGYASEGTTAEVCASKLLAIAKNGIAQRVQELMAGGAKRAETTVASLLNELEQARAAAQDDRQFSAAVQAIAGKARLTGLDNRENGGGGSGSEFDKCETVEQVIAMLVAQCGSPAQALADFDELREMIERYAASHAALVPAAEPARPRLPGDETATSLALFRPTRKGRR